MTPSWLQSRCTLNGAFATPCIPFSARIKAGHGKANANLSLFQLPKATYLRLLCCLTSGVLASRVFGDAADMELGKTWIHFQATSKSYSPGQDPVSWTPQD